MKNLFATAAIIALCTTGALAAPSLDATETAKVDQMTKDAFKKADTNGDGFISKSEHEAMMDTMFTAADTNNDGKLSIDEIKAAKKQMAQDTDAAMGKSTNLSATEMEKVNAWAKEALQKGDTDGDNMLSRSEHAMLADKMFADADSNSDGKLSMDEVRVAKMKMMREVKVEKTDSVHGNVDTKNGATK